MVGIRGSGVWGRELDAGDGGHSVERKWSEAVQNLSFRAAFHTHELTYRSL